MLSILLFSFICFQDPSVQESGQIKRGKGIDRASLNGPVMKDPAFQVEKSGYAIFLKCKDAIQQYWIPHVYQSARAVDLSVHLDMKVKPPRGTNNNEPIDVTVDIEGLALPNGQYKMNIQGELGEMDIIRSSSKKMLIYHLGKGFSDQNMPRAENANLKSYSSYALRYLGLLKDQVVTKGGYRFIYVGSGNYQGQLIDRIKIAKVDKSRKKKRKKVRRTVQLNRLWMFWQSGEYELWVYRGTHLPAAIFYSNPEDQIYSNITVSYDSELLPSTFMLQNNSTGFEGSAEIQLEYGNDRTLERCKFRMLTTEGHDLSFDARLNFKSDFDPKELSGIPPLGYQKLNPDHLKVLMLTPIIGNLLNLKQKGLKLKSFAF